MARTTPKLNLNVWDSVNDYFSHSELANNFDKIDAHDHSPGKGTLITASGLASNVITSSKILDGSITRAKIASYAIDDTRLDSGSVTTTKIGNAAVTSRTLAPIAGIAQQAADSTVTTSQQVVSTVTFVVEAAGHVLIDAHWYGTIAAGASTTVTGEIRRTSNGVAQTVGTGDSLDFATSGTVTLPFNITQTYYMPVAIGTHILEQRVIKTGSAVVTAKVGTRFTYLVIGA